MTRPLYRHSRWWTVFEAGTTIIMVVLAAFIVWEGRERLVGGPSPRTPTLPLPNEPIQIGSSNLRGVATPGSVAVVEYADFECPYCARFAKEVEPALMRDYFQSGRVVFVFKNFPLPAHRHAVGAAKAAWCASQQGNYWDMHDRLFAKPAGLEDGAFDAAAADMRLDLKAFLTCRSGSEAQTAVDLERSEGEKLRVTGTPAFFFGKVVELGRVRVSDGLRGAQPIQSFRVILDKLLGTK